MLELVDGPTLADRIALGPMPMDEALTVAGQMAEALEAAHEKGIIHRDLKPANIKIARNGIGQGARLRAGEGVGRRPRSRTCSTSPTLTATGLGGRTVLGTPAYMSPEQARGQTLDRRTDMWAFGCVLYEMLTGRPPFAGDTVSDTLATILEREPPWTALPVATPAGIRQLLKRCLEKEPKRRLATPATPALKSTTRSVSRQWTPKLCRASDGTGNGSYGPPWRRHH